MGDTEVQRLKFVVVGDSIVGKTCLLMTYISGEFPKEAEYVPTIFENHSCDINVDRKTYNVCLWDTAGHEQYRCLRDSNYSNTHCFIICYSINNPASFDNIESLWIPEIRDFSANIPYILVATKIDIRETATIDLLTTKQGKKLCKKIGASGFIECSSKHTLHVHHVFEEAVRATFKNRNPKHKLCCCCIPWKCC